MSPLAIGTDLGGSIREPAAFTGIVGIRPSLGLVPNYPVDMPWGNIGHGRTGTDGPKHKRRCIDALSTRGAR